MASPYAALVRGQVRSQLAYPLSFVLNCLSAVVGAAVDLVVILVVFSQITSVVGFSRDEVLLLYGLGKIAMTLADLVAGQVEKLPDLVRTGTLDALLLRPLPALAQVFAVDLQLRRLAGTAVGLAAYVYALAANDVRWSVPVALLVVLAPLLGAVIFGCFFVAACSLAFWVVEAGELPNVVTYGTSSMTPYPIGMYPPALRRIFCLAVPSAWVAYFPALAMIGKPDPLGLPEWWQWSSAPVAALCVLVAGLVWRTGLRRYRSTGS